jgi:hypothetical protein
MEQIPLDKIHPLSFKRQVRAMEIDPEVRDQYQHAMAQGDHFPPLIGRWLSGKFFVDDGIHRVSAAQRLNLDSFHACVGQWDDDQARLISFLANARHGLGSTREERIHQAIELHRTLGYDLTQAADLLRISRHVVTDEILRQEGGRRAAELGLRGFDRLPPTTRKYLARIEHDEPFKEATEVTITRKLPVETVGLIAKAARGANSDAAAVQQIHDLVREGLPPRPDTSRKSRPALGMLDRVRMVTGSVASLDEARYRMEITGLDDDDRAELRTKLLKTVDKLKSLADAAS